jgi:hypothetical protein
MYAAIAAARYFHELVSDCSTGMDWNATPDLIWGLSRQATENNDDERASKKTRSEEEVDFPNSTGGDDDGPDVDDDGDDFGRESSCKEAC